MVYKTPCPRHLPPLIYTFLLAYSPRRFLPAASAVLLGDITLVLSAARNFLIEQSQMSGEAGTEHSEVDLHEWT